ncbi:unnamed protein product [Protopolystoma xenopodis]|uniref:Uncharacterized protein n=1 Tax=Protopolystoma xenopodis TaxID=117903 RepID=A0A448XIA4_9PLAT|nr:unnamed protein product [Protopolystoma xenopodis]
MQQLEHIKQNLSNLVKSSSPEIGDKLVNPKEIAPTTDKSSPSCYDNINPSITQVTECSNSSAIVSNTATIKSPHFPLLRALNSVARFTNRVRTDSASSASHVTERCAQWLPEATEKQVMEKKSGLVNSSWQGMDSSLNEIMGCSSSFDQKYIGSDSGPKTEFTNSLGEKEPKESCGIDCGSTKSCTLLASTHDTSTNKLSDVNLASGMEFQEDISSEGDRLLEDFESVSSSVAEPTLRKEVSSSQLHRGGNLVSKGSFQQLPVLDTQPSLPNISPSLFSLASLNSRMHTSMRNLQARSLAGRTNLVGLRDPESIGSDEPDESRSTRPVMTAIQLRKIAWCREHFSMDEQPPENLSSATYHPVADSEKETNIKFRSGGPLNCTSDHKKSDSPELRCVEWPLLRRATSTEGHSPSELCLSVMSTSIEECKHPESVCANINDEKRRIKQNALASSHEIPSASPYSSLAPSNSARPLRTGLAALAAPKSSIFPMASNKCGKQDEKLKQRGLSEYGTKTRRNWLRTVTWTPEEPIYPQKIEVCRPHLAATMSIDAAATPKKTIASSYSNLESVTSKMNEQALL